MSIDRDSYTPAYLQLADLLRARIGKLPPGEKLPSETELMKEYDLARITVRAAIKELRGQGLVETRRRGGSYVRREIRVPMDIEGPADVSARMPTPQERKEMKIPEGVPLLVIEREGPEGPVTELVPADRAVLKINRRD